MRASLAGGGLAANASQIWRCAIICISTTPVSWARPVVPTAVQAGWGGGMNSSLTAMKAPSWALRSPSKLSLAHTWKVLIIATWGTGDHPREVDRPVDPPRRRELEGIVHRLGALRGDDHLAAGGRDPQRKVGHARPSKSANPCQRRLSVA